MQESIGKKTATMAPIPESGTAKPAGRPRKATAPAAPVPPPGPLVEPVATEKPARKTRVKKDEARAIVMDAMEKLRKLID
jgi:hypothetical protein